MSDCGLGTPIQHLERCGLLGENLLAAHVNYLGRGDAALLAKRGVHVVHCPRSHFYFRHDQHSLKQLRKAGVNICLGTDSLASVYRSRGQTVELNLFEEMALFAANQPELSPRDVLRTVTINAARALGLSGMVGELTSGAWADLITIPFHGGVKNVYDAILNHRGGVTASMIGGEWAIPPLAA
jgi:cytosine/adenosine deaminase-related metal-dependent hydrolase